MAPSLPPAPPSPSTTLTPFSYASACKTLRRTSSTPSSQLSLCTSLLSLPLYPPPYALILHHLHHICAAPPPFPTASASAAYFRAYWTLLSRVLSLTPSSQLHALLPPLSPDFLALAARQLPEGDADADGACVRFICDASLSILQHTIPPAPPLFATLLYALSSTPTSKTPPVAALFSHLLPLIPSVFPTQTLPTHASAFAALLSGVVPSPYATLARRYVAPLLLREADNHNRRDVLVSVVEAVVEAEAAMRHVLPFVLNASVVYAQRAMMRAREEGEAIVRMPVDVLNTIVATCAKFLVFPETAGDADKSHLHNVATYRARVQAITRLFQVAARLPIIDHSLVRAVQHLSKKPRLAQHNHVRLSQAHPLLQLLHSMLQTASTLQSENCNATSTSTLRLALAESVAAICEYSIEPPAQFLSLLFVAFQPPCNAPARVVFVALIRAFAHARRLPELLRAFALANPAPFLRVCCDVRVRQVIANAVFRMHKAVVDECIDALIAGLAKVADNDGDDDALRQGASSLTAVLVVVLESFGPQGPSQMPTGVQQFVDILLPLSRGGKKKGGVRKHLSVLMILKALLIAAASGAVQVEQRFETCCAQLVSFLAGCDSSERAVGAAASTSLCAALWTKLSSFKPSNEDESSQFLQLVATLVQFYTRRLGSCEAYDAPFVRDVCHVAFEHYQAIRSQLLSVIPNDEGVSARAVSFNDLIPPLSVLCHAYDSAGCVVDKVSPHIELFLQDAARAFVVHDDDENEGYGAILWEHLIELAFVRDMFLSSLESLLFQSHSANHAGCEEKKKCLNANVFSLIAFLASRLRQGDVFSKRLLSIVAERKSAQSYCCSRGQRLFSKFKRLRLTSHGDADLTGLAELFGDKKGKNDHASETSRAYTVIASIVADLSGVDTGYLQTDTSTANNKASGKQIPHIVVKQGDLSSSGGRASCQIDDVLRVLEPFVSRPGSEIEGMKTNSSPLNNQLTQQQIMLLSRVQKELVSRSDQIPNGADVENIFMIACVRVCQRLISKRGFVTRWPVAQLLCNIVRRAARLGSVRVALAVNNMMNTLSRMLKREQLTAELCCSILGNFCHAVSQCAEPAFRRNIEMGMAIVMNEMSATFRTRLLMELDEKSADVLRQVHEICLSKVQYYGR